MKRTKWNITVNWIEQDRDTKTLNLRDDHTL